MDLSTTWLGLHLPHPLVPGASPLVDDLDVVRRLEDAGAAAIVMHSLFEEQLEAEARGSDRHWGRHEEAFAEAQTYFPELPRFTLGPEEYLEQVRRVKEAVAVPVVGSLNGTTKGGWIEHARRIEEAGADALELNVYRMETDPEVSASEVEDRTLELVRATCDSIRIPVAVKLSPFYTALANVAAGLVEAGAAGLVLFNRFYQPDIDVEELEVDRTLHLSERSELNLRLRWIAILSGRLDAPLAVTGGVHEPLDALKAVMAGASCVQVVSALLRLGPERLGALRDGLERWLEEHEYESLEQARGSMDLRHAPDSAAWERANYVQLLQTWHA